MALCVGMSISTSSGGEYETVEGATYWYPYAYGNTGFILVGAGLKYTSGFPEMWLDMCHHVGDGRLWILVNTWRAGYGAESAKLFSAKPIGYIEKIF